MRLALSATNSWCSTSRSSISRPASCAATRRWCAGSARERASSRRAISSPWPEETGLICPIGDWVLRKACEDAASWLNAGTVAVNFCAAQFRAQAVDQSIARVLKEIRPRSRPAEIEVPEACS